MAKVRGFKLSPSGALLALCITGSVLAFAAVSSPFPILLSKPTSFLGLDVMGGVASIETSTSPDHWWGPFDGTVAPQCNGRPFEIAVREGEFVARQADEGAEITLGPAATAVLRCDGRAPVPAPADLRVIVTDAVLPFAGRISIGQQVTDRQVLFSSNPLSVDERRRRENPALVVSGEAWARTAEGKGTTSPLKPGDNVMFTARGASPVAYGALIVEGKSLRTIARARGDHVSIRRWGQRSAERDLVRPSPFDRLQSAPFWAWLAVVSAILISVLGLWAAHLQTKIEGDPK